MRLTEPGSSVRPCARRGFPGHCRRARASMTVEASLLMVLILFVIFGVLCLFFHVHNRAWLTAAAYETAVTAAEAALVNPETAQAGAQWKLVQIQNAGFIGGKNLKSNSSVSLLQAKVTFRMETEAVFGGFHWDMNISAQAPVIRPTFWIRQVKAASGPAFRAAP